MYTGEGRETASTNKAVDDTHDQVITYRGKVAAAYFFSASGGHTENIENVFYGSNALPYLRGVDDPYDTEAPRHKWKFEYTKSSLGAKLGSYVKGKFKKVDVVKRGVSPRIVDADVVGTGGRTRVKGSDLRTRLGWYDNWAVFTDVSSRASTTARGASWIDGLLARPAIAGRIDPAPRGRRIELQRRTRSGWKNVRRASTARSGVYRVAAPEAGTYRVAWQGLTSPAARIRP
jgi:stage II sporulation protein D